MRHNPFPNHINEMHAIDFPPIAAIDGNNPIWQDVPNVQYEGEFDTTLPVGEFTSHISYCFACESDSILMNHISRFYSIQADISAASEMLRNPQWGINAPQLKELVIRYEKRADDKYREMIDRSNTIHQA